MTGSWVSLPWGDRLWLARLPGGPRLAILPRVERSETVWQWTVPLPGRLDGVKAGSSLIPVPPGAPHLLEHLLFEKDEGDISVEFALLGLEANAYTTEDYTTYVAAGSASPRDVLPLLLALVHEAIFTEEDVERERLIIQRELALSRDDPGYWRERSLREALFYTPSRKEDLLGSPKSLKKIDSQFLRFLHRTFYHPSRGLLVAAGPLEPEEVAETVDHLSRAFSWHPQDGEAVLGPEPEGAAKEVLEGVIPAAYPWTALAWKVSQVDPEGELLTLAALQTLLGRSSPWREWAEAQGQVDDTLAYGWRGGRKAPYLVVEGETEDPEGWLAAVQEGLRHPLQKDEVHRTLKRLRGRFLRSLDHPGEAADLLTDLLFYGYPPGIVWDGLSRATAEAVEASWRKAMEGPRVQVILRPREGVAAS